MRLIEGLITAVPCFVLAATMLFTWIDPMSIDSGSWVRFGVGIMALEFLLVHSGAMMGSMAANTKDETFFSKLKVFGAAFAFYSLFAGAMALAFQSWTLFIIYSTVMLSRWIGLLSQPAIEAKAAAMQRSGYAVLYYLLAVFLSVLVPWPRLGVTYSIVSEVYPDRGAGHWERHPESALAAGIIYFSLIGLTELYLALHSNKQPPAE